jgi:ubiquinone/menaquinone biosynthesis C-methylase UbiE
MGWYDVFSRFYDRSLERLYAPTRIAGADLLQLREGDVVLDLPCGTGLSFDVLSPAVGETGCVVGVDRSTGMLARARARAEARGLGNVTVLHADVHDVTAAMVQDAAGGRRPNRLHIFLGMTAFPRHAEAFEGLWSILAPGGRCAIIDVHAASPGFQGRMVNLVARADIRREVWRPLQDVAEDYRRDELPSRKEHGGGLFVASGRKPA